MMEKSVANSFLKDPTLSASRVSKGKRARLLIAVLASVLLLLAWTTSVPIPWSGGPQGINTSPEVTPNGDDLFVDWDAINPSEDLIWVPCYRMFGNFLCARLTVPLDYARPLTESAAHPKVHVALVMLPGKGHEISGNWSESPLLLNPGGPGGEGTAIALMLGALMQTIVGPDQDIIGFDPRGIGATTPPADCFLPPAAAPSDATARNQALMHRLTWLIGDIEAGLANTSDSATDRVAQRQRAFTKFCYANDEDDSILRYIGTPHVAQDMLSIVQAWDRWTAAEKPSDERGITDSDTNDSEALESTRGKLVYWGFSYGTVLGATFATMFPNHVGRMVLDGVVNTDEYYFGDGWTDAAMDADKVLDSLFTGCHRAGEKCALYRPDDEVADIRARVDSLLDRLRDEPALVFSPEAVMPTMITYSDIKRLMFGVLYAPSVFPIIAVVLDDLYRERNIAAMVNPVDVAPLCASEFKMLTYPTDGGRSVLCSDEQMAVNFTKPALKDLLDKMSDVSSFADVLFSISMMCAGWEIEKVDPPSIDWDGFPRGGKNPVNTSFPILFISNTLDPITPRHSGLWQTRNFANAGFVEQLSEGHCSLAAPSLCTTGKVRDYFNNGVVPSPPQFDLDSGNDLSGNWSTCPTEALPWAGTTWDAADTDAGDFHLKQALQGLQREFRRLHRIVEPPRMFERLFDMEIEELAELVEISRGGKAADALGEL